MSAVHDPGSVAILNVGDGDTKLSFDPSNPAERIRAARIVRDMLRRGYALLIEVEVDGRKVFQRATDFKEDVCEYVIADFDPLQAAEADVKEAHDQQNESSPAPGKATPGGAPKRGRPRKVSVPAETARAVVVAPVAGG